MGLWLVVAVALGIRGPRGFGGQALRARLDAVYGEPHELVRVEPDAFPDVYSRFSTLGTTTVLSGSRTTKNICLIGPLTVSEKEISQNGTGVVRNS